MVSGFLLVRLSWLQTLFERQQINVREKPSSSACYTTQLGMRAGAPVTPRNVSCVHGKWGKSKRGPIVF